MRTTHQKPTKYTQKIQEKAARTQCQSKPLNHRETKKMKNRELQNNQELVNNVAISACLSIITLSVKGQNAAIQRSRVAKWIKDVTHRYDV